MTTRPKPSSSLSNRPFSMARGSADEYPPEPKLEEGPVLPHQEQRAHRSPFHRTPGQHTPFIKPDGESYRRGIHPIKFLAICWKSSNPVSSAVNVLWPAVPAAIALVSVEKLSIGQEMLMDKPALCSSRMASRHIHRQLRCNGSSRKPHWLRWSRVG
jgi:hypothetical protein